MEVVARVRGWHLLLVFVAGTVITAAFAQEPDAHGTAKVSNRPRASWEAEAVKMVKGDFKECGAFRVQKYRNHPAGFHLLREPVTFRVHSDVVSETQKWNGLLWSGKVVITAPMYGTYPARYGDSQFSWIERTYKGTVNLWADDKEGMRIDDGTDFSSGVDPLYWDCKDVTELPQFPKNAVAAKERPKDKKGQPKVSSLPLTDLDDLRIDIASMKGKVVRVRGIGTYVMNSFSIAKDQHDNSPLWVDLSRVQRDDRKRIMRACTNIVKGCPITIQGKIGEVEFQTKLIADSVEW